MSSKWEKISEETVYDGYRKVIRKHFKLPNGKVTAFDIKKEGEPVCALVITKNNEVVLAKQFRPGPEKVFMELPGGGTEEGETPIEAMGRELQEETGYHGKVEFVQIAYECAYSTRKRYCFVVTECEKIAEATPDENEFIEVVTLPLDKFKEHIRSGKLTDTDVAYIGLDYLGLS